MGEFYLPKQGKEEEGLFLFLAEGELCIPPRMPSHFSSQYCQFVANDLFLPGILLNSLVIVSTCSIKVMFINALEPDGDICLTLPLHHKDTHAGAPLLLQNHGVRLPSEGLTTS